MLSLLLLFKKVFAGFGVSGKRGKGISSAQKEGRSFSICPNQLTFAGASKKTGTWNSNLGHGLILYYVRQATRHIFDAQ